VALSWLNLPCALKAPIGIGKRTSGDPGQSAARRGPQQGPSAWGPAPILASEHDRCGGMPSAAPERRDGLRCRLPG
jgi:hypothetical protein